MSARMRVRGCGEMEVKNIYKWKLSGTEKSVI